MPHNVKSIQHDFETRKCGSTFWVSKSCLRVVLILASPVTECRAKKLALFSCKFCDRNEGTGLAWVWQINYKVQQPQLSRLGARWLTSSELSESPQWILAVRRLLGINCIYRNHLLESVETRCPLVKMVAILGWCQVQKIESQTGNGLSLYWMSRENLFLEQGPIAGCDKTK